MSHANCTYSHHLGVMHLIIITDIAMPMIAMKTVIIKTHCWSDIDLGFLTCDQNECRKEDARWPCAGELEIAEAVFWVATGSGAAVVKCVWGEKGPESSPADVSRTGQTLALYSAAGSKFSMWQRVSGPL